jgi:ceramide glucosyltransferase
VAPAVTAGPVSREVLVSFTSWLIAACIVALVATIVRLEQRRRALRRPSVPPPALARYPSLTVVHPVRGLDPGARENIAAALDLDYPGEIEDLFVFDDEAEPALPLVRAAIAERAALGRAGRARVIIAGPPRPGYTGKLSAMNAGVAAARGDLVAFADSDVRVDRETVRVLVDLLLGDAKAGSVFAPVVVSEAAQASGDVGYQIMLNSLYSPEVALWSHKQASLPFIMGQLMVFRRDTLRAIGGVDCARGQLVDDMHIGTHVVAAGLRNVMAAQPVRIVESGMSLIDFARTARRWLVFSRSGIPRRFALSSGFHYFAFWLGLVGLAESAASGSLPLALAGATLMAAESAVLLALNRATGGPPVPMRWWWMPFLMFLTGPIVYVSTWLWPHVGWRGRTYDLNAKAELDTSPMRLVARIRRLLHA